MTEPVRVLHVDDDAALLDIAATFLERADPRLKVTTETDPTVVVDRLEEEHIDCVVSDYDMPEMTGLDLLQQLQSCHPDLPFVLFTGTPDADIAVEALDVGATEYCRKQVGTDHYRVLAARIVDTVDRHRERERLEAERDRLQGTLEGFSEDVRRAIADGDSDAERIAALKSAHKRLEQLSSDLDVVSEAVVTTHKLDTANTFSGG